MSIKLSSVKKIITMNKGQQFNGEKACTSGLVTINFFVLLKY